MEDKFEKLVKAYSEGASRPKTWSGFPVEEVYTPEDTKDIDYKREIGDPGDYPFTRGIHATMFRGRVWTKREVAGFGTPEDTNERVKYLIDQGQSGINIINDLPTAMGVDSDHPMAKEEAGAVGAPFSSLKDMEEMVEGIPLEKVSMSFNVSTTVSPIVVAQYLAIAQKRGIDLAKLRGTIQNEPLKGRYCGYSPSTNHVDLCLQTSADIIEFCSKYMPLWYTTNVNLYDLRETGINAAQEIAFGFAMAIAYIENVLKRGLDIDEFAPRIAFYCSAHIDFFEEIAKLRTARRIWAKIMKERYKAKNPKSLTFKFGVHTAGCSLVPQQPMNNVIRVAYEALAAVLGGVQSLHCCSYDEPIAIPTEESHRLALRTQQILACETGVANVADPLAGSYYLESLTNRIEEEATMILKKIDDMGGMIVAIEKGWIDQEMEKAAYQYQKEVESKERIIVGVNEFTVPPEEDVQGDYHKTPSEVSEKREAALKELRETRDNDVVRKGLKRLNEAAEKKQRENLLPFIIEAVNAYATTGEILGTIRMGFGYTYDPFEVLSHPFFS
ncbi:MAG: methylmalonyl-CoA mutase [Deltaproteobacteria bacterium CG12_big_fil_rev_8_21_14_0_65_43_10]|nr:MAG: methylmalonyl-CoA mutase [Deltaproteobacteria bacterium CG12_big_fil_rev_8_21_14_0_65_43_10]PIU84891.1 MAG: methylmalonyl-CoA mutase [Deltaproteobacteria bacterium CG06_land_8_20_14_3_00_44_19]PIX23494.1 MAG: methylmalonyl-CoA mutase [Deltaproteobacteria bacterium CG_4_8_14_3_um_filter_43_13]PIZ19410.1 MAG: methylmalonyl-CoA mutase [Deltaproteobacteria bacterium CG_4_10_14_0_8_um_filter_43_12]PJB43144.1 MAG: methylmalonyl-CoA mutase [Deltaproteobacteria bacterium CG_4_9_14_3_um_filter_4